jgi:hypothetical protein
MRMRVAGVLAALAGCDSMFNLDRIELVDAIAIDLPPPFDPLRDCVGYDEILFASTPYRVTPADKAWVAYDDCADDSRGYTHLAVAETREELDALIGSTNPNPRLRFWVGGVQPRAALEHTSDWTWLTGEPIASDLWSYPPEPNDLDNNEADHAEQFVIIQYNVPGLADMIGSYDVQGLCECDGRPIEMAAARAVDEWRP